MCAKSTTLKLHRQINSTNTQMGTHTADVHTTDTQTSDTQMPHTHTPGEHTHYDSFTNTYNHTACSHAHRHICTLNMYQFISTQCLTSHTHTHHKSRSPPMLDSQHVCSAHTQNRLWTAAMHTQLGQASADFILGPGARLSGRVCPALHGRPWHMCQGFLRQLGDSSTWIHTDSLRALFKSGKDKTPAKPREVRHS